MRDAARAVLSVAGHLSRQSLTGVLLEGFAQRGPSAMQAQPQRQRRVPETFGEMGQIAAFAGDQPQCFGLFGR